MSNSCGGWAAGDLNGDGTVDAIDLNIVGQNWLRSAEPARAKRTPKAAIANEEALVDQLFAEFNNP